MPVPTFVEPRPVRYDADEEAKIAEHVVEWYGRGVQARESGGYQAKHQDYEDKFRGTLPDRPGPWKNASNLHVQMPYWLVDSVAVRTTAAIWNQIPLVGGQATEDDDEKAFRHAADLVKYHLQPNRMNARTKWHRMNKLRLIHGVCDGLVSYVKDTYTYTERLSWEEEQVFNPDGSPSLDDDTGEPITRPVENTRTVTRDRYVGPVLTPLQYNDLIDPVDCENLQPQTPSNPHGADQLVIRQWESLNLMFAKSGLYRILEEGETQERQWWINRKPPQDRSLHTGWGGNQQQARAQDLHDGVNRDLAVMANTTNPEFEVLTWMGPWEDPESGETTEMIFFVCTSPKTFLGGIRLGDAYYKNKRPLLEMHYQTVGLRRKSMGLMEITQHLSAELDTLHNMRIDVGYATNMPYFFYSDSSGLDPDEIELKPLKGIPIRNPQDVRFPPQQGVTTFYLQEEAQLYTLIERVVGVTDLFLGMSPTRGAAARHATGFVGTQQEALARTSEVINQDAIAFSQLCHMIYEMEMQYGPSYRDVRLTGHPSPPSRRMPKHELWMVGEYDFQLGANQGSYNQQIQQGQAQFLAQEAQMNPLIAQDPARLWESTAFKFRAYGFTDEQIVKFIGPREALGPLAPKSQGEEIGAMVQHAYGYDQPAPVNINDDDQAHLQELNEWIASDDYRNMGRPNIAGMMAHAQMHVAQMTRKQQQINAQQQQQVAASAGNGQPSQPNAYASGPQGGMMSPEDNILPQLMQQSPTMGNGLGGNDMFMPNGASR